MKPVFDDVETSNDVLLPLADELRRHLCYTLGRDLEHADAQSLYRAAAIAIRDQLSRKWLATRKRFFQKKVRRVHYLSLEFLLGRSLNNAIQNLDIDDSMRKALHGFGLELEEVVEKEHDAGLGNGGLGRLAACFLDSCANLDLPVAGYGIRYEFGMFHQRIEDGQQIEAPDHWLLDGNPWEIKRDEDTRQIHFFGHTESFQDETDAARMRWVGTHDILAIPFDMPIPGYRNDTVNTLRLWKSSATDAFNLEEFNAGSYPEAVAQKNIAEQISMVLYPNDSSENGKELRLKQQYFFVSASLQDVLAKWVVRNGSDFSEFGPMNCFQLNDTHPACAVPELMRLLIDEYGLQWEESWEITTQCMAYTNHTLLPEALERWSVAMFSHLLPRLMEIIYEINERFLLEVSQRFPDEAELLQRVSLIEEGEHPHIRMAYLSIVGSFSVNGVAHLHTELLKSGLFADFYRLWPERFNNKTNGVTQRRWLSHCNPKLRELLNGTIGDQWESNLDQISALTPLADDDGFRVKWQAVKQDNKNDLADYVYRCTGQRFNPSAIFDVQVKRIHEYKRQLLNVLHAIHLYDRIQRGDIQGLVPRCILIGGKAAPGYHLAKLIVRLIHDVGEIINQDPATDGLLQMAFFPNYRVSAMEVICPGTDLSEQISTAGKEASGTGNMKFMMNGALTIGTLDGANIEIREKAGNENFFLFGLDANQVNATRKNYHPNSMIAADDDIQRVMDLLEGGHFNAADPDRFRTLTQGLRSSQDQWLTIADLRGYINAQQRVNDAYKDQTQWQRMSILNAANSGWFSSDRTIRQYADEIWKTRSIFS
ncbi:glycogen/starch/alpha-glucan phosphorylase [Mariniblastus sp.]|nr:glycogen/starch/alpha-glucan phosphorylase [Mariniblastus sp.]MDB4756411.1 glycogen/starch/alpha-glucan phosphorylase [Mariniblastus sp.]